MADYLTVTPFQIATLDQVIALRLRMDNALQQRTPKIRLYTDYYEGVHRLAFATPKFRSAFGNLFSAFADNWCDLVVDAVEERLNPLGWRRGPDERQGDEEAWEMWQTNGLDAESQIAHLEALINGEAYAMVGPDPSRTDPYPLVTIEHPREMITMRAVGNRRKIHAAWKRWLGEDGHLYGTLYTGEYVFKWVSESPYKDGQGGNEPRNVRWIKRVENDEEWGFKNQLGTVPVVPICNRPRLLSYGESEIAKVIPAQDAVNKLIADMLVASEYTAMRQRWATGYEVPENPETHEPLETFEEAVLKRLWIFPDKETQVGEFSESSLEPFVKAIEMMVQHIASRTRTPPHYFYLSGQFPSGESIKSAETGLTAKARRKMRFFGENWEDVFRLMFLVRGDEERAKATQSEMMWADPESRSESEHVDAVIKMKDAGVPEEILWEKLGFTNQEIARIKKLREEQASQEPPTPPVAPPPPGEGEEEPPQ